MLLFLGLGTGEIFMIFVIVLLLFGSSKIPEFAKGLAKGIRYMKDATNDIQEGITSTVNDVKKDVNINKEINGFKRDFENTVKDPLDQLNSTDKE
jgi:sec-independent protein translocase protein TatA